MKLPNNIEGWLKCLADNNATVVKSPAGSTLRFEENSTHQKLLTSHARQMVAKTLVEHFGTIAAVNKEIGKIKIGKA